MFNERADYTLGAGGAAWYTLEDGRGPPLIIQTQWPSLVAQFQERCKNGLIKSAIYAFGSNGTCGTGSILDELPAFLRSNVRRRDAITVDGQWGGESADLLGALLCITGQTTFAAQLASSIANKGPLPPDIVRSVIFFGRYVRDVDMPSQGAGALPPSTVTLGSGISLAADTVMPRWDKAPIQDSRDAGWFGQSEWGDPMPNPPSRGGGMRPWPGPPGTTTTTTQPGTTTITTTPASTAEVGTFAAIAVPAVVIGGLYALAAAFGGSRSRGGGGGSYSAPTRRQRRRTRAAAPTLKGKRGKRKTPRTKSAKGMKGLKGARAKRAKLLGARLGNLGLSATPKRLEGHGLSRGEKALAKRENTSVLRGHRSKRKRR